MESDTPFRNGILSAARLPVPPRPDKFREVSQFAAADVEEPLSAIMGTPCKVPAFSLHLNEMCRPERGAVLRKTCARRTFQYLFAEATMRPYIIMKSLKEGIISKEIFDRFNVKRQKALAI
jgi:hypothetical protein